MGEFERMIAAKQAKAQAALRAKAAAAADPDEESVFGLAGEHAHHHQPPPRRRRSSERNDHTSAAEKPALEPNPNAAVRKSGLKQPSRLMQPKAGRNKPKSAVQHSPERDREPRKPTHRSAQPSPRDQQDLYSSVCSDGFGDIQVPQDEPEATVLVARPPSATPSQHQRAAYQPGWGFDAESEEQQRREKQRQYQAELTVQMEQARAKKDAEKAQRRQDEVMPLTMWDQQPDPARVGRGGGRGISNSPRLPVGAPPPQPEPKGFPPVSPLQPQQPQSTQPEQQLADGEVSGGGCRDPFAEEAARKAAEKEAWQQEVQAQIAEKKARKEREIAAEREAERLDDLRIQKEQQQLLQKYHEEIGTTAASEPEDEAPPAIAPTPRQEAVPAAGVVMHSRSSPRKHYSKSTPRDPPDAASPGTVRVVHSPMASSPQAAVADRALQAELEEARQLAARAVEEREAVQNEMECLRQKLQQDEDDRRLEELSREEEQRLGRGKGAEPPRRRVVPERERPAQQQAAKQGAAARKKSTNDRVKEAKRRREALDKAEKEKMNRYAVALEKPEWQGKPRRKGNSSPVAEQRRKPRALKVEPPSESVFELLDEPRQSPKPPPAALHQRALAAGRNEDGVPRRENAAQRMRRKGAAHQAATKPSPRIAAAVLATLSSPRNNSPLYEIRIEDEPLTGKGFYCNEPELPDAPPVPEEEIPKMPAHLGKDTGGLKDLGSRMVYHGSTLSDVLIQTDPSIAASPVIGRGCTPQELELMGEAACSPIAVECGEESMAHGTLMMGLGQEWASNLDLLQEAVEKGRPSGSLMPSWDEIDEERFGESFS